MNSAQTVYCLLKAIAIEFFFLKKGKKKKGRGKRKREKQLNVDPNTHLGWHYKRGSSQ